MSTKTTIRYMESEVLGIHLYEDLATGYAVDIRVRQHKRTILLTKEEAENIDEEWEK